MTLPQIAFVLFAAVASGGVLMTGLIVFRVRLPGFLGPAHGLAGLAALVFLFGINLHGGDATPSTQWWALGVFFAGFVGGLLLFRVLFKEKAPLPLAALHGSIGAVGLWLLYGSAF
jgi:hypothetical protein